MIPDRSLRHRSGRIAAVALMVLALNAGPGSAVGPEDGDPAPTPAPTGDGKDGKGKPKASGSTFREGYRAAYDLIRQGRFEAGIAALRALNRDDHPDVANFLGYASRKLGRYDDAKVWYERALAADPRHARTWSYYGMWHAERGNVLKAREFLEQVRLICGSRDCREFRELEGVIEGTRTY